HRKYCKLWHYPSAGTNLLSLGAGSGFETDFRPDSPQSFSPYYHRAVAEPIPSNLQSKLSALETILRSMGKLLVAYSGGVDSAFLADAAHRILGDQMLAVIADSPSLARSQLHD